MASVIDSGLRRNDTVVVECPRGVSLQRLAAAFFPRCAEEDAHCAASRMAAPRHKSTKNLALFPSMAHMPLSRRRKLILVLRNCSQNGDELLFLSANAVSGEVPRTVSP